ncbi:MAG: PadR family transcriptional regulator [Pirellulaceae bacterium]
MTQSKKIPLLQGTLDLLILHTLRSGPMHGYSITKHIRTVSDEVLQVEEGSLYPALHRLEKRGWVKSHWGVSETNRRAKFYQLSTTGKKHLATETQAWDQLSQAVDRILMFEP